MKMHYWMGTLFWIMIGMYVAIHAYQLGLGRLRQPGPGLIFFLAALLLIFLGILDLVGTFIGRSKTEKEEGSIWLGLRWQKVLLVFVVLLAYVYFLNVLGFVLSAFLLMVFLFKAIEPTKWRIAIVGSIITISISYSIFEIWLKVPFPRGFLGF